MLLGKEGLDLERLLVALEENIEGFCQLLKKGVDALDSCIVVDFLLSLFDELGAAGVWRTNPNEGLFGPQRTSLGTLAQILKHPHGMFNIRLVL